MELNEAIRKLLVELNARPLKVLGISRRELFERVDAPALRPLPEAPYVFAQWKKVRVGVDYHCEFEGHYYSVPYQLIKEALDLRATEKTVEIFHRGKRVAGHRRDRRRGKHTTVTEHMPKSHQAHVEWTPKRLVSWALRTGDSTSLVVEGILRSRPHPQQGFRACLGLMRLGKRYGDKRVEAACARAIAIESLSYQSVKSILKSGLDQQALVEETEPSPLEHANVRGAEYYEGLKEEAPC